MSMENTLIIKYFFKKKKKKKLHIMEINKKK